DDDAQAEPRILGSEVPRQPPSRRFSRRFTTESRLRDAGRLGMRDGIDPRGAQNQQVFRDVAAQGSPWAIEDLCGKAWKDTKAVVLRDGIVRKRLAAVLAKIETKTIEQRKLIEDGAPSSAVADLEAELQRLGTTRAKLFADLRLASLAVANDEFGAKRRAR